MIAVLRIDASGVVVAADASATRWLGAAVGGRCCDVVLARSGARQMVCETTCAARAVRGDGGRWETV